MCSGVVHSAPSGAFSGDFNNPTTNPLIFEMKRIVVLLLLLHIVYAFHILFTPEPEIEVRRAKFAKCMHICVKKYNHFRQPDLYNPCAQDCFNKYGRYNKL
uniref:Uncharacterized protein n=1 Tax=Haemonchus contortus TaxID=6289 RepID=A0A7I4Y5I0_HAECO